MGNIPEHAVLIAVRQPRQNETEIEENLAELAALTETSGAVVKQRFIQKLDFPNTATYLGKGKVNEVAEYIKEHETDIAIFDDELTPTQVRNLEKLLASKVLDRTNLILDIFAGRARTAHAKTQVELAQYQYLLPRLTRLWTHLERQRGGIGMRGPGEREIETDRRIIRDRIAKLKKQLSEIDRQMQTQRKKRHQLIRVALVGYTNAGKSTLMTLLSKSEVFAEDKLFATLDTTVRKIVLQNLPFLLSDTVGFIRKLPTELVESFKSTLDEIREADLILHLVDISHPNHEEHIEVVQQTLRDIDAGDKPVILIFNKIDNYHYVHKEDDDLTPTEKQNYSIEQLNNMWIAKSEQPTIFISAKSKTNIQELRSLLYQQIKDLHLKRYPHNMLF